jgi:hypothetical protein
MLLVTVPIILDQAVGERSGDVRFKIIGTMTKSLIQNNGNSNQQPDSK